MVKHISKKVCLLFTAIMVVFVAFVTNMSLSASASEGDSSSDSSGNETTLISFNAGAALNYNDLQLMRFTLEVSKSVFDNDEDASVSITFANDTGLIANCTFVNTTLLYKENFNLSNDKYIYNVIVRTTNFTRHIKVRATLNYSDDTQDNIVVDSDDRTILFIWSKLIEYDDWDGYSAEYKSWITNTVEEYNGGNIADIDAVIPTGDLYSDTSFKSGKSGLKTLRTVLAVELSLGLILAIGLFVVNKVNKYKKY